MHLCWKELFEIELVWHLNYVLMLPWIAWNGTIFWHWNCVLMLNWIIWNITLFLTLKLCSYAKLSCLKENLFDINLLANKNKYSYTNLNCLNWIVLCIKMDLSLITCNGWYAIKANQTNPNKYIFSFWLVLILSLVNKKLIELECKSVKRSSCRPLL